MAFCWWEFDDDTLVQKCEEDATWWDTLTGWITTITQWAGSLTDIYKGLENAGIITSGQKEQAEAEGWTKEELIALIRAQMAPTWQTYLPWIVTGGLGIGLILVLVLRK